MTRILLILVFQLAVVFCADPQDYSVAPINDSLKKNANAVLREELYEYTFITAEQNITRHKKIITVLNKNGDEHAEFMVGYNKFQNIKSVTINIYDAGGKLTRKVKNSEITDNSGSAGYPMFADIRYRYYRPLISTYPYTVEFDYEMVHSGSYYFPDFMFFEAYNVSIEKATFRVKVPNDYKIAYKEINLCPKAVIKKDGSTVTYEWQDQNIPALDPEPYSDEILKHVKAVMTAPSRFSLDGYEGYMDSWQEYAKWISQLNAGRDNLPENRVAEIREMVKDAANDREKIRLLYSYMQGRTRYFNISLGIGGLQPADAKTVDEVGYGDCKGLSNYMKALLKAAGINSYYVIAEAGGDFPQMIEDFPKHQFNHAILCVPIPEDTVWLECTSQILPFGFLGDFTSDRQVLVIKEQGGELVRTPAYPLSDNFQNTHAVVKISLEGNGNAIITRNFGGLQYDNTIFKLHSSGEDQKDWLYDYYDMPNFTLNNFEFKEDTNGRPQSVLTSSVGLANYGSTSGKRLFLPLNLTNRSTDVPSKLKVRRTDIRFTYSWVDNDTVEYEIPEGMTIEFLPEARDIKSCYGEYRSSVEQNENRIIYFRQVKMFKGHYPKESYNDLIKFFYDISVADKSQAILIKKES